MFAAIGCVFCLSAGQLLFKASAKRLTAAGTPTDLAFLAILGSAFAMYGLVSIAWVMILQRIDLSRVYPIMALSFVLVPLGGWLVFREVVSWQYVAGVAFIMAGICLVGLK